MSFIKSFFAALLAFVVGSIVIGIFGILVFATFLTMIGGGVGQGVPVVKQNTVLKIDLKEGISDSPQLSAVISVGLTGGISIDNSVTILQAVSALKKAESDRNIKGAYINVTYAGSISLANLEELRAAIDRFRRSGKFVISYSDSYSQTGYYLSSVADRVYLNPEGMIDWRGLASSTMFYKGALDKLGVRAQILRHGSFKSAVEPFMLEHMSPESRTQMSTVLNSIWGSMLHEVAQSRGIDSLVLSAYAGDLTIDSPEIAFESGMIDGILYEDQVIDMLGRLVSGDETIESEEYVSEDENTGDADGAGSSAGQAGAAGENGPDMTANKEMVEVDGQKGAVGKSKFRAAGSVSPVPDMVSLTDYVKVAGSGTIGGKSASKNKIAVIYADGDIIDGDSRGTSIGSATIASKLAKVRNDDAVKAVVIRVNSPGGSALASEVIWRAIELVKEKKPVVVSMGGTAASGGYYISCPADLILTDRSTLTGSIGVFGIYFDVGEALSDKLGITVDVVKTNPSADLGALGFRGLSAYEYRFLMKQVEDTYVTFVDRVAGGRNMSTQAVDAIGGGRVWSGVNAVGNGLADGYGGILDAIEIAADRAGVSGNYKVWQVIDSPDNISMLMRTLLNSEGAILKSELGDAWKHYNSVKNLMQEGGVQARTLYDVQLW